MSATLTRKRPTYRVGPDHEPIYVTDRDRAEVLACGLRIHREEITRGERTIYYAKCWLPKATIRTTWYYSFRTVEAREQYISHYVTTYATNKASRAQDRENERTRAKQHADAIQPGHVFVYSWGYDQTNVEYFQVTEKHGQMLTLRPIAASAVPGSAGFMCESVEPRIGHFLEDAKPIRKRPYFDEQGHAYLSFEFGSCSLWRGGAHYQSWYA